MFFVITKVIIRSNHPARRKPSCWAERVGQLKVGGSSAKGPLLLGVLFATEASLRRSTVAATHRDFSGPVAVAVE